jgi:DNA-binding transcriptional LysR family regulator
MAEFTVVGLRVVREAARCRSFSAAAERLGYTQSAVSRHVALMEQVAGCALFERRARGVALTAAGRVVVRRAEAVLDELDAIRGELRDLDDHAPARLRIGAFSTAMAALVPRAIAALTRRQPQTRVTLRETVSPRLLTSVARGHLDLAVVTVSDPTPAEVTVADSAPGGTAASEPASAAVALIPLLDDPLLVALPPEHPLAGRPSVAPAALRDQRWIVGSTEPGTSLLGAWTGSAWQPDIAFIARDWVAKIGLVRAGLGVTIVPGLAVSMLPPDVAVTRIDHPSAMRTVAVAAPHGGLPDSFIEDLRDAAVDLATETRQRLRA